MDLVEVVVSLWEVRESLVATDASPLAGRLDEVVEGMLACMSDKERKRALARCQRKEDRSL